MPLHTLPFVGNSYEIHFQNLAKKHNRIPLLVLYLKTINFPIYCLWMLLGTHRKEIKNWNFFGIDRKTCFTFVADKKRKNEKNLLYYAVYQPNNYLRFSFIKLKKKAKVFVSKNETKAKREAKITSICHHYCIIDLGILEKGKKTML